MEISKKRLAQINLISVFDEVYRAEIHPKSWTGEKEDLAIYNEPFYTSPPEEWSEDETELFELMTQIEERIKEQIINVLH